MVTKISDLINEEEKIITRQKIFELLDAGDLCEEAAQAFVDDLGVNGSCTLEYAYEKIKKMGKPGWAKDIEKHFGPRPEKEMELKKLEHLEQSGDFSNAIHMKKEGSGSGLLIATDMKRWDQASNESERKFYMILMVKLYEKFRLILKNHSPGETLAIPYVALSDIKAEAEEEAGCHEQN